LELFSPKFITNILRDEHQSQEFLAYTADYLKLDQKSIHRTIVKMLKEKDHKNKDIMKLVNPSIFDFFASKLELAVRYFLFVFKLLGMGKTIPSFSLQLHQQMLQMSSRRL